MPDNLQNAETFSQEVIREFERNTRKSFVTMKRTVTHYIYKVAVQNSRIRTGFMVSRWGVSVGELDMTALGLFELSALGIDNAFDDVFVKNDCDYVSFHEFGTVYISPQPMLAPGVQAVENWIFYTGGSENLGPSFFAGTPVRPAA